MLLALQLPVFRLLKAIGPLVRSQVRASSRKTLAISTQECAASTLGVSQRIPMSSLLELDSECLCLSGGHVRRVSVHYIQKVHPHMLRHPRGSFRRDAFKCTQHVIEVTKIRLHAVIGYVSSICSNMSSLSDTYSKFPALTGKPVTDGHARISHLQKTCELRPPCSVPIALSYLLLAYLKHSGESELPLCLCIPLMPGPSICSEHGVFFKLCSPCRKCWLFCGDGRKDVSVVL